MGLDELVELLVEIAEGLHSAEGCWFGFSGCGCGVEQVVGAEEKLFCFLELALMDALEILRSLIIYLFLKFSDSLLIIYQGRTANQRYMSGMKHTLSSSFNAFS